MNPPSLHNHTYFSLLDGVPSPEAYMKRCEELDIPAIAFTEHGNMASHIQASIESENFKVRPILGMEAYVVPSIRKMNQLRNIVAEDKDEKTKEDLKKLRSSFHLVLLAKNSIGYENLSKINNKSWTEGFYYRNRTDFREIFNQKEGLIALSACQSGIVSKLLLEGKNKRAIKVAKKMKSEFGKNFYLEFQLLDMEIQDRLNKKLVQLGTHLKIPFVLTNDCHYVRRGDHELQSLLIHISTKGSFEMDSKSNYLKTLEELERDLEKHKSIPRSIFNKAIDNTFKIADECTFKIKTGDLYFPEFDHTSHFLYKQFPIKDKLEFFKKIIIYRARKILGSKLQKDKYKKRLLEEFNVFRSLGGIDYFLIVDDLLHFVRESGAFSLIRGSANGSLVAFVFEFGIIDPIEHKIMFERFISKYRSLADMDVDIDVRSEFRPKAVEYLKNKYGNDRVFSIGTYGRMQLKGAIKDVTRAFKDRLDIKIKETSSDTKADKYAKRQKQFLFPVINRITSGIEGSLTVSQARASYEIFDKWYDENEDLMKKYIEPLIGNIKNVSLHPAGVVILPEGKQSLLPIRTQPNPQNSKERVVSTVWENSHTSREDLNEVGVMVLDVLGVRTLSIVSEVINLIKETTGKEIDIYNIDLKDKDTFKMFNRAETLGVFQFSGASAHKVVEKIKITDFNDLIVINALTRPGALAASADDLYAERKRDPLSIEYDHPSLEAILEDSLGVLTFSEQILKTASDFAGMYPKRADNLRKIIKGKNVKLFKQYKKEFIKGALKKWKGDLEIKTVASNIWKSFSKAGSYLFPRGHAASYAMLGYICMYLKVHYPIQFFTCHLRYKPREEYGAIKAIAEDIYNIKFIMPNIQAPKIQFEAQGGAIWWPVTALKNIAGKAAQTIIKNIPYNSFEEFFSKVNKRTVNKRVMENLIIAGAFSEFGNKRSVLSEYKRLRKDKNQEFPLAFTSKESMAIAQEDIFGFEISSLERLFKKKLKKFGELTSYEEFLDLDSGDQVTIFGRVFRLSKIVTKKGDDMGFATVGSGKVKFDVTLFPDSFSFVKDYFEEGNVLIVSGKKNVWNGKHSIVLESLRGKKRKGLANGSWVKRL